MLQNVTRNRYNEISIVSSTLFTFLSEIFVRLHQSQSPFSKVNVLAVGDLAQLPPVNGSFVFNYIIWQLFYPLFLRNSQRQQNDPIFYKLLEEIRFGKISAQSWTMLEQKHTEHRDQPCTLMSRNGTVGIVTHMNAESKTARIAFIGNETITDAYVTPKTIHFTVNGNSASRTQFPLQDCFALTVHKSQGLTLPRTSVFLDSQFFAPGQAYVALIISRASTT